MTRLFKERPLLFTDVMVRALLAGTKTQTRRIVKFPVRKGRHGFYTAESLAHAFSISEPNGHAALEILASCCPYGAVGDRFWLREAYRTIKAFDHLKPSEILARHQNPPLEYIADGDEKGNYSDRTVLGRSRHAPFMPRWASRLTLEIASIRVERLQDISEADALAEGVGPVQLLRLTNGQQMPIENAKHLFERLWESIHGPDSWAQNPWVWAIEFRRIEGGHND